MAFSVEYWDARLLCHSTASSSVVDPASFTKRRRDEEAGVHGGTGDLIASLSAMQSADCFILAHVQLVLVNSKSANAFRSAAAAAEVERGEGVLTRAH